MTIAEKLVKVADNVQKVYDTGHEIGYDNGYAGGYAEGYEDGKAEGGGGGGSDEYRTAIWNGIQHDGARNDYQNAFRNWKNADKYWKPIHDIEPTNANMMFYNGYFNNASLPELCEQAGITLSFAKVATFSQPFSYCSLGDVGIIDTTGAKSCGSLLMWAHCTKAHIILKEDGSQTFNGTFTNANNLTDLIVEGGIGNSLSIPSPLTPESMISVITHLVNYAGTDKEGVNTITFTDACWTALEVHSTAPDGGTWQDYVMSLGWRI